MNVFVTRHSGWYGKFVPLDLLCNGKRLTSLTEGSEVCVKLDPMDMPATLEMRMQNMVGSPKFVVSQMAPDLYLECGSGNWTLFDFFDLSFLPSFSNKVFFLRRIATQ